ncbi:hypothetical protein K457DRAFT_155768 [Linnemannia elongata AG-77]|uniref:Crinkler effector protein N-terminal domain-containing protein n=1 Tax=Linnemannia elongata AG-77 TaxID=1314771 RepID=A0A197JVU2_9FUNG|nr:hypothetical protein K457DRAFT_155768 [Linnemannia elongata AG-77]
MLHNNMTEDRLNLFCLVDGEPQSNVFSIKPTPADTVDDLKKLIKAEKTNQFSDVDADQLTLWHVSFPVVAANKHKPIVLNEFESATELDPTDDVSDVFPDKPPKKTIHIIVQRPPPVHAPVPSRVFTSPSDNIRPGSPVSGIMDVIKQIKGTFHPRSPGSDSARQLSSIMPWQERPMDATIDRVVENVGTCLSWQNDRRPAKAESSFLVCSGTAGIGKTRYGRELYDTLRRRLSEKAKAKGVDYSPHYHYMLLDFGIDAKLGPIDTHLDADTILGLRLAYTHFFQDRYDEGFSDFCYRAVDYRGLFTIPNVIIAIRQDLKHPAHQPFFLFLHIDEFQRIFDHRWEGTPKGHMLASLPSTGFRLAGDTTERHTNEGLRLFQDMMRSLGPFMSGAMRPHMIQTFLSGTARQDVILAAEPTSYSFKFLSCPTLSTGACYDIMGHFTGLAKVPHRQWMPKMAFLHLLSATGGLPRALQLLLEEFFGRRLEKCNTFADTVDDINMNADRIFNKVASNLDNYYSITAFVETHRELVCALVRLCILQQPSPRTLAPSDQFPALTLDVLERDTHTILEDGDEAPGKVLVRIPFFFLHLYNTAIDEVRNRLGSAFLHDWVEDREWGFFERMIAEYEALRTNLLIGDGREAATLGEIYQGAIGRAETLGRIVKLKKLSVVTAAHRFPESGGLTVGEREQDWRSGVVIKNADGAQFGDICVYREKADGNNDNILCALQAKKIGSLLSAPTIQDEHDKNKTTIEKLPDGSILEQEGIKRARTITVLITTADISDDAFQQLNRSFPDDCLLIYRGNFTKFFGDAFSISAALAASKDLNWNFATRETLKKKHKLADKEVDQILENMPYRSYDDLIQKVPAMSTKNLDKEMGFLPYQDFQPEKRRRVE